MTVNVIAFDHIQNRLSSEHCGLEYHIQYGFAAIHLGVHGAKKTGAAKIHCVFGHAGLLVNGPPGFKSGLPFI
jgi:hypothetical protein